MTLRFVFVFLLCAFTGGCGSTRTIDKGPDIALPAGAQIGKIRVDIDSKALDSDDYDDFRENRLSDVLRKSLASELSKKGRYATSGSLVMHVRIIDGRLRSALSAAVFSGLDGVDKVHANVSIKTTNGRVLKNFESRSEFGSGGVLGTSKEARVELLAENLAEEIGNRF